MDYFFKPIPDFFIKKNVTRHNLQYSSLPEKTGYMENFIGILAGVLQLLLQFRKYSGLGTQKSKQCFH